MLRALVVDDSEFDREAVRRILLAMGIEFSWVDSLEKAAGLEREFDMLILDVRMPTVVSPEVTKNFANTSHTPVIIMTGAPELLHDDEGKIPPNLVVVDKGQLGPGIKAAIEEMFR